ncbi:hypothetical protein [Oceanobacillus piezotolerans]|nr:hypothetical protein [Oceanobacillus piezotolerans]
MSEESKERSMQLFSNDALKGKPYLDIDRVIRDNEVKHKMNNNIRNK